MISLALVCPPREPHWALLGTGYHLIQATWCLENGAYRDFYKACGGYRILDYQHIGAEAPDKPLSMAEFVEVAKYLEPDEVVSPDVLDDSSRTLRNLDVFLGADIPTHASVLFVPQGSTLKDWYLCLSRGVRFLREADVPYCIGICKKSQALDPYHRSYAVYLASRHGPVHILGARNVREFIEMAHLDVRSWDTSLPIAAAQLEGLLEDQPLNWKPQLIVHKSVFVSEYVLRNVHYIRKLLAGAPPLG